VSWGRDSVHSTRMVSGAFIVSVSCYFPELCRPFRPTQRSPMDTFPLPPNPEWLPGQFSTLYCRRYQSEEEWIRDCMSCYKAYVREGHAEVTKMMLIPTFLMLLNTKIWNINKVFKTLFCVWIKLYRQVVVYTFWFVNVFL